MKGRLINDATGKAFELEDLSSIGRSRESTVVLPDARASRRHAVIRKEEDGFWLFDLGSSNGSYLNGRRVTTAQRLQPGDVVRIGPHIFTFEMDGKAPPLYDKTATELTTHDLRSQDTILLASDIRGYTGISEKLRPDELAPIIGTWYSETEQTLQRHGATLDRIIGDCVLAYWLTTTKEARHAAIEAARGMQQSCDQVQRAHGDVLERAGLTFWAGAALHIGPAARGYIGPGEFTLLGDAVNLVFRLEGLTRKLHERLLVSAEFLDGWSEGRALFRSLGHHEVKGREQPVEVFAMEGAWGASPMPPPDPSEAG